MADRAVADQAHSAATGDAGARGWKTLRWMLVALSVAAVLAALVNSRTDVRGTRVARPPGSYLPARTEFLGIANWYAYFQAGSLVIFVAVWAISIRRSVKRGKPTPTLIMVAVTTALTWLDPIMNWAPYAAYDPRMLHLDPDWFWIAAAPTVEPWAVIIGYGYFFLIPAWLVLGAYKRLAARAAIDSWIVRKPKTAVLAMAIPICILWDALMETLFVRMGFYTYTQVIPVGSIFAGHPWQFPLIWEASLFGLVLAPTAALMWVDDHGQTWSETVARRFRVFRSRPHIGAFLIALAVMSVVYAAYGLCFAIIRISGAASAVAIPWRYPETSVYDPQGYFQKAGSPGPFYVGTCSGATPRRQSGGQ